MRGCAGACVGERVLFGRGCWCLSWVVGKISGRGGGFLFFLLCAPRSLLRRLLPSLWRWAVSDLALSVVGRSRGGGLSRCAAWALLGVRGARGVSVRLGCVRAYAGLF